MRLKLFFCSIIMVNLVLHLKPLKQDLVGMHTWRQTYTVSNIVNFYDEDFNILNPKKNDRGNGDGIQRMEFPIMQWLFAGVLKITGKNIFIIKLLNFAVGILTLVGVFRFLKLFFKNRNVALIGCWAFSFSPSFYYFIVSPIPDNFAMMCSIWGLVYFLIARSKETQRTYLCAGILLSLGTLAKLPFILYYAFILGYFVWIDNRYNFSTIKNYLCLTSPIMLPLIQVLEYMKLLTLKVRLLRSRESELGWSFPHISCAVIHSSITPWFQIGRQKYKVVIIDNSEESEGGMSAALPQRLAYLSCLEWRDG